MLVSSAYKKILAPLLGTLVMSLMNRREKSGPRTELPGTPSETSAHLDEEQCRIIGI
jgi:hypothetical protein